MHDLTHTLIYYLYLLNSIACWLRALRDFSITALTVSRAVPVIAAVGANIGFDIGILEKLVETTSPIRTVDPLHVCQPPPGPMSHVAIK